MEATQKLEATQVLDFSSALDDEEAQEGVIVGRLVVEGVTHLVSGSEWKNSSIIIMNKKRTTIQKISIIIQVHCGVTKLGRDPTADIHVAKVDQPYINMTSSLRFCWVIFKPHL